MFVSSTKFLYCWIEKDKEIQRVEWGRESWKTRKTTCPWSFAKVQDQWNLHKLTARQEHSDINWQKSIIRNDSSLQHLKKNFLLFFCIV